MRHWIAAALSLLVLLFPAAAPAQDEDSVFADYAAYSAYVDKMITSREWEAFILKMGGRDEYSPEELARIVEGFDNIYRQPFTQRTIFREVDHGGGIWQEARAYWGGGRYLFYYGLLHERDDALVVLNFSLNTNAEKIMSKF